MKKGLVHDWYYINGGAEKVIHSFNNIWDDFSHYALVDFLNEKDRQEILHGKRAHTSFIQNLPTAKSNHRKFLQLFPYAIEQFDLRSYDLILSSSSSVAKGVLTHQDQLHICYCHSPVRYAWDLYHQYLEEAGLVKGLKGVYAKYVLHKLRNWDVLSSNRVDHFIANSQYIAQRIKKTYSRESTVIYPPVNTGLFGLELKKNDYYFTASRMVPYKKVELIVRAFNDMPDKKLIVAGDGPDYKKITQLAKANIELVGFISDKELKTYMQNAKAFVYAAEEDFGIVPVEAQACGTPVIGYGRGGLKETVIHEKTGLLFPEQTLTSIKDAVQYFERLKFDYEGIHEHALKFSKERFEKEIKDFVENAYTEFLKGREM
ncbi:glycosyltransferase [Sinomicrobium weinanense]|uniref:Glycosyltransferase n=1 Tax=Sinomicrobium weinanense TaxID=2842200 RepID=A0A926JU78_9FLAO|nr:glycosyltransferase [Sinomicrobium weinanense]MBC9797461.1 glycosyltransferase [Sinomicrobium weinanense]MBU3125479.1 glycosyltransferase [Sinomicrobium weinanense]